MIEKINALTKEAYLHVQALEKAVADADAVCAPDVRATYYKDNVLQEMDALRKATNGLESIVSSEYWPFPTYGDLLFEV